MSAWHNGAKVGNLDRLQHRANIAAFLKAVPERQRPPIDPEALEMARAHPKKGWARRWLRERGLRL